MTEIPCSFRTAGGATDIRTAPSGPTRSTRPSGVILDSRSRVESFHVQVRIPWCRSTVRNASVRLSETVIVSLPYGVERETPFAYRRQVETLSFEVGPSAVRETAPAPACLTV